MGPTRGRLAAAAAAMGVVGASLPASAAAAAPPCAQGTFPQPEIRGTDLVDGARLTATHRISLAARFSGDEPGGVTFSGPGVRGNTLVAPQAGAAAVRASWDQTVPNTGEQCTASTTATLNVLAPVATRFVARRGLFGGVAFDLRFARIAANLGPLEVRVRAVRGRRLPGSRVPFVKRTLMLLDTNQRPARRSPRPSTSISTSIRRSSTTATAGICCAARTSP
jgi:hypothetical protein